MSRCFRAVLCLCVAMSLLPVAAPPADAAAANVSRNRLAGATRYETAVEVAEAYIDAASTGRPGLANVILTSGEERHFGYALATPALSKRLGAPLLLTRPDELPGAVLDFLSAHRVEQVVIVGGAEVVSEDIEAAVRQAGVTAVERIDGGDPYGTAAVIAARVGPIDGRPGLYRTSGRTAILATGEKFADGLAAGPFAYDGQHPILLTPQAALHSDVSKFFVDSRTEHVVIVGGPAAVSDEVQDAIEALDIDVTRLYGGDRFATAVSLAEHLLGLGVPDRCFDGSELGLAFGRRSADAIVSSALLGEKCAPLLLSDVEELPRVTRDFLASDEFATGDAQGDLDITVFGGEQAISSSVARAAQDAATLQSIRATIEGLEGRCFFTVNFSEPVLTSDAESVRNYRIDGDTIDPLDAEADGGSGQLTSSVRVAFSDAGQPTGAAVPVGCGAPLVRGEELEIVGGVIGTEDSGRKVGRTSAVVQRDRSLPRLTVSAYDGVDVVWVESDEPLRLGSGIVEFSRGSGANRNTYTVSTTVTFGAVRFEVELPPEFGGTLESGDRVTVETGAVRDLAGNRNSSTTVTARRDSVAPRISRVTVTEPLAELPASLTVDATYTDGGRARDSFVVTAKADGNAAGAAGNGWTFEIEVEPDWTERRTAIVSVTESRRRILMRVSTARTLNDVVDDVNDDDAFARLFEADLEGIGRGDDAVFVADLEPQTLSGGLSSVELMVVWSEPVLGCDEGADSVDPGLLEIDADSDGTFDYYLDGRDASRFGVDFRIPARSSPADFTGGAVCVTSAGTQSGTLLASMESDDLDALPNLRSRLFANAGAAVDRSGNESADRRFSGFSRP